MRRIYLDNAATSFPKPPGVYAAMVEYGERVGASPGRGQYAESREGARRIRECRERIARLIGGERAENVIFTLNTSDALNVAIKGVIRQRRHEQPWRAAHVVLTAMEHNSVLRPVHALCDDGAVEVTHVAAAPSTGVLDPTRVIAAIRQDTALVCMLHASNVAGAIQDIASVGRACRERGVMFLVDAAQSLGHVALDVRAASVDLLAFPGHKGLLGPQGTGGLYIRPGVEGRVATWREGGTGHMSERDAQPETMPEKFEGGSHNTIGIVGLSAAVGYILDRGVERLREHEIELSRVFLSELRRGGARLSDGGGGAGPLCAVRLLGPRESERRVGVFAMTHDTLSPGEVAAIMESGFGVLCRAGLTCAPGAHSTFGTHPYQGGSGAFRLSFGAFTTEDDVRAAVAALHEICRECSPRREHVPHLAR